MALLHLPLDQIDEARLRELIVAGAPESRTIDYKRTTYGNNNDGHSEFLADVSSFANSAGGDIILGMDAKDDIPVEITPLSMSSDDEILRLEQMARGGLQPRMAINFHPVQVKTGGWVLIVRVPRSYNGPHRITRQNSNRFWARSTKGRYEPDVGELRALFNVSVQLAERMRNFRIDRIAKITAKETPVPLKDEKGILAVHVIPYSAFEAASELPLKRLSQDYHLFAPFGTQSASGVRINFDGVLRFSNPDQSGKHRAYVQNFRSGIVEVVSCSMITDNAKLIPTLSDRLVGMAMRLLSNLTEIGIQPPCALLVSLINVRGARLHFARGQHIGWSDDYGELFDRDQYNFSEAICETVPTTPAEAAQIIRPILDEIANAGGLAKSNLFDENGGYQSLQPN